MSSVTLGLLGGGRGNESWHLQPFQGTLSDTGYKWEPAWHASSFTGSIWNVKKNLGRLFFFKLYFRFCRWNTELWKMGPVSTVFHKSTHLSCVSSGSCLLIVTWYFSYFFNLQDTMKPINQHKPPEASSSLRSLPRFQGCSFRVSISYRPAPSLRKLFRSTLVLSSLPPAVPTLPSRSSRSMVWRSNQ